MLTAESQALELEELEELEELDEEEELETHALHVPVLEVVDLPRALSNLHGVFSALCEDSGAPPELSQSGDALTLALDVRTVTVATEASALAEAVALDEDVEFIDEEPSDARTVVRNLEVLPIADASSADSCVELPEEVCTRPGSRSSSARRSARPLPLSCPR